MSTDDSPLQFETPGVPDVSVDVSDPTASDGAAALLIFSQLGSIVTLFFVQMNIIGERQFIWIPLAVVLFSMLVNPLVTLKGVREAVTVVLQGFNFMAFMLVIYPDATRNALVIAIALLLAFFLFEFPGRFGIDFGGED